MQRTFKTVEAVTLDDVATCLNLLQDAGRAQVEVVLLVQQHPWRLLVKVTPLPLTGPYTVASGLTLESLVTHVNMLHSEGYHPVGGILSAGTYFYQAMMAP